MSDAGRLTASSSSDHKYVVLSFPNEWSSAIAVSVSRYLNHSSRAGHRLYPSNSPLIAAKNTITESVRSFAMMLSYLPLKSAACVTAHPPANRSTSVCALGSTDTTHSAIRDLLPWYGRP